MNKVYYCYVHRNRRLSRDGSPGRPPRLSHSSWALKCCFTSTETVGLLGTGAQDGLLDFHTAPELSELWESEGHVFDLNKTVSGKYRERPNDSTAILYYLYFERIHENHAIWWYHCACAVKSIKMSDDEFMVDDDEEYDLVGIVQLIVASSVHICFANLLCTFKPVYALL